MPADPRPDYPSISAHHDRPAYVWRRSGVFGYLHLIEYGNDIGGGMAAGADARASTVNISAGSTGPAIRAT